MLVSETEDQNLTVDSCLDLLSYPVLEHVNSLAYFLNKYFYYFLFEQFYVRLLDYSILVKARHYKLICESTTLHIHELI